jgi:hypothetical protein
MGVKAERRLRPMLRWRAEQSKRRERLRFLLTRDDEIPPSMYFHQYPATFLFSKDGRIAMEHAGGADWADPSVISFIDHLKSRSQ